MSKDDPEEMDETWLVGKKGKCEEGCEELGLERSISGYLGCAAGIGKSGRRGGAGLTWVFCLIVGFAREETDCGEETLHAIGFLQG